MKNSLLTTESRFKVAHCIKNVINLDSSDKESSDDFTFEESSQSYSSDEESHGDPKPKPKGKDYLRRLSFGVKSNRDCD